MTEAPAAPSFSKEEHVILRLASTFYLKAKNSIDKFRKSILDNEDSMYDLFLIEN